MLSPLSLPLEELKLFLTDTQLTAIENKIKNINDLIKNLNDDYDASSHKDTNNNESADTIYSACDDLALMIQRLLGNNLNAGGLILSCVIIVNNLIKKIEEELEDEDNVSEFLEKIATELSNGENTSISDRFIETFIELTCAEEECYDVFNSEENGKPYLDCITLLNSITETPWNEEEEDEKLEALFESLETLLNKDDSQSPAYLHNSLLAFQQCWILDFKTLGIFIATFKQIENSNENLSLEEIFQSTTGQVIRREQLRIIRRAPQAANNYNQAARPAKRSAEGGQGTEPAKRGRQPEEVLPPWHPGPIAASYTPVVQDHGTHAHPNFAETPEPIIYFFNESTPTFRR